ncbi:MAG TPA: hypothetical protein VLC48_03870 [Gemmatimonadota bacterium]|nr:hypothetical protein [Gemmatimonadota bacterium]
MKLLIDVGGWIGAALILVAYYLVSTRRVHGASVLYQTLNIVGSLLVGANAFYYRALPSFSINVVWIAIAILALGTRPAAPEPQEIDSGQWKEGRSSVSKH